MLAVPGSDIKYDAEEEEKREQEIKMAAVESMLTAQEPAKDGEEDSGGSGTVFRVVNNVQVDVKRIHVRFEDMGGSSGSDPFCCGLTLGELSAKSATEAGGLVDLAKWPEGLDDAIARKSLKLEGLSVYWNAGAGGFNPLSNALKKGNDSVHGAFQTVTPMDSRKVDNTMYYSPTVSSHSS